MVPILVGHCNSKDRFNRLTAVQWVHEFIKLGVREVWNRVSCSLRGMACGVGLLRVCGLAVHF